MDDLILPARYETLVTPELNCNWIKCRCLMDKK
jgi:hypothetical protein